jgi:eukaryotic-like serine/threonine-protein kinase
MPPSTAPFAVGDLVSERYRIEALLGEGAMGAVYRVEHVHMRKRYALKVLLPDASESEEIRARFEREALAAAHIDHPNVVAATDFGRTERGDFFLVLEYVEGRSLREVVEGGPLDVARVSHIAAQIGRALAKAHGLGIVHRDLKPENVMLVTRPGEAELVKVLDFGIAKVPIGMGSGGGGQALTRMGAIFGTPEYMAPEQAVGDVADARADLYSLGIVLYELLTGVRPFDADDLGVLLSQHVHAPVPPMSARAPGVGVPPAVEAVVRRLLEKSASDRYATAREATSALEAAALEAAAQEPADGGAQERAPASAELAPPSAVRPWARGDESAATVLPSAGLTASLGTATPTAATAATAATGSTADGASPSLERLPPVVAAALSRARSALEAAHAQLPAPLRAMPPVAIGAVAATVALTLLVAFALLVGVALRGPRSSRHADTPGAASATATARAPERLDDARLRDATAKGIEAVAPLAREFPRDPRVPRAELTLHLAAHRGAEAMEVLARLLALDPDAAKGPEARAAIDEALAGSPEAQSAAFALLEGPMGEAGVDLLLERAAQPGPLKARCLQSLAKPEVRAHASPAATVALGLREAKSCEARRALLEDARDHADERSLPHLRPLTYTRGCGFLGTGDCWRCLRGDKKLDEAIKAIEARRAK